MRVLVTGGLGFIGSHTVVSLVEQGHIVTIVDDLSNSNMEVLSVLNTLTNINIPFYKLDVTNESELREVFEDNHFDAVIHFAGYKAVEESIKIPLKYYFNNVMGLISVTNICKEFNVKKFVLSSSATVYGDNKSPFYETMTLLPTTNPYGETKVMCERILADVSKSDDTFEVAILRYFNPIGAHESGLIGELPKGAPNNLMPYISQVAKGKISRLQVYGEDYPTIDGSGVRDYIHVVDLADGHVAALEHLQRGVNIYNLGTGKGTSVLQLISIFEKVNGVKIPYVVVERRKGDIAVCYANVEKAEKELKWKAMRTVEDMCRDAWKFENSTSDKLLIKG